MDGSLPSALEAALAYKSQRAKQVGVDEEDIENLGEMETEVLYRLNKKKGQFDIRISVLSESTFISALRCKIWAR